MIITVPQVQRQETDQRITKMNEMDQKVDKIKMMTLKRKKM